MTDLDRAYTFNGDDLHGVLSGVGGRPPLVPNPRDVTEYILATIAKPLDGHQPGSVHVTREALEETLAEFCHTDSDGHAAWSADVGSIADAARALYGQLSASTAREPEPATGEGFEPIRGIRDSVLLPRREPENHPAPAAGPAPELTRLAAVLAELDALETDHGYEAVERHLEFICSLKNFTRR